MKIYEKLTINIKISDNKTWWPTTMQQSLWEIYGYKIGFEKFQKISHIQTYGIRNMTKALTWTWKLQNQNIGKYKPFPFWNKKYWKINNIKNKMSKTWNTIFFFERKTTRNLQHFHTVWLVNNNIRRNTNILITGNSEKDKIHYL